MTSRYELLLMAISDSNRFMTQMFVFSFLAVIAYPVLDWIPLIIRRPMKYLYLAFLLAAFLITTVYSWEL